MNTYAHKNPEEDYVAICNHHFDNHCLCVAWWMSLLGPGVIKQVKTQTLFYERS